MIQQVAFFKQRLAFLQQVVCCCDHNGKASSTAILSMRDNVMHVKWKVLVENLAKKLVGSWIYMG
jgi:hypothetical protein